MITPILFQSYDFQDSFPVKLIEVNSSDFRPSCWFFLDPGRHGVCGPAKSSPGAEGRVEAKDHGRGH